MRSEEHLALAEILVSSPLFLSIPIFCWALYGIIVCRFNEQHMVLRQHEFLYSLLLVKPLQQNLILLLSALAELAPVLLYSVLLFCISWRDGKGLSALLLFLSLITISILVVVRLRLTFFGKAHRGVFSQFRSILYFTKPYFLFFIVWIFRIEFLQVVFTKAFTIMLLFTTAYLYTTDEYDTRLFLMSLAMAGCVHGQLIWQLHRFENYHMMFTRNLPISIWQRLMNTVATSIVLLIPELGVIMSHYSSHVNVGTTLVFCGFIVSITLLFYGLLFRKEKEQEQLISLIFFLCIGFIVLVLYKTPAIALVVCNSTAGIYFLCTRYYSFEYSVDKKNSYQNS